MDVLQKTSKGVCHKMNKRLGADTEEDCKKGGCTSSASHLPSVGVDGKDENSVVNDRHCTQMTPLNTRAAYRKLKVHFVIKHTFQFVCNV